MKSEVLLRNLAESVAVAIQNSTDVLYGKNIEIPDLSHARYTPNEQTGFATRPVAHRFIETIASLNQKRSMKNIFDQLRIAEDLVIWGHAPGYNRNNVGQEFLDNYCHALVSGPDGPLDCASPLGAFVLFGPDTLYKDHSHAPNEVYLAVTDGGEWRVGDSEWIPLSQGDTIFIPSNAVHAIRTGANPLLTFSFWLDPGEMDAIEI